MKNLTIVFSAFFAFTALAAAPALAQTTNAVRVNVPFKFVVANQTLPEGQYLFSSTKDNVFIQDSHGRTFAMVLTDAVTGRTVPKAGQIVFQCYEQRCFLSEVWNPTEYAGRQLPKSRREKELARKEDGEFFALIGLPDNNRR